MQSYRFRVKRSVVKINEKEDKDGEEVKKEFCETESQKMTDTEFIKKYLVRKVYNSFEILPFADALYSMYWFIKNFEYNFLPTLNNDFGKISNLKKFGDINCEYEITRKNGSLSKINLEVLGNKISFLNWFNHELFWSVSAKNDNLEIWINNLGGKKFIDKWKSFWPQKFITNLKWYKHFMKINWGFKGRGKTAIHSAQLEFDMDRFKEFKSNLFEEIERRRLITWCIRNDRGWLARKADPRTYDNYKNWISGKLVWTRVAEFFNKEPKLNPNSVLKQKDNIQQKIQFEQELTEFERQLEIQSSMKVQRQTIPDLIYRLNENGSVTEQNWTETTELSIKNSDPEYFIYETNTGIINGISAPSLINKIKNLLIFKDKHTIKSAGRIINNLIALAGFEQPFKHGKYYWERLFPVNTDFDQLKIPTPYQKTFIYRVTLAKGGPGRARWMKDFQNNFLFHLADWFQLSGLKDFTKQITIQNPITKVKYKKRFNNLSAYLKFKAGLGEWIDEKWQGTFHRIFVLKYDPEHIFATIKYVCESIHFTGDNRTGKNKKKLVEFIKKYEKINIIHSVPKSRNFKFIISLSSRNRTLSNLYKNLSKNAITGSKFVQAHLTSVLENCKPAIIDPWTVRKALNQKHLKKPPEDLKELLTEMKDGPINSFCAGLFVDPNFRNYCNEFFNLKLIKEIPLYPNTQSEYIISQSIKGDRLADAYGKSFTASSIPDVVTNYQKNIGSTEYLFIKVVNNDIMNSLESDISEILKTNYDLSDPFRPFTAYVFTNTDLKLIPLNYKKQKKILLFLRKHNANGLINIEIPDLCTKELNRFGEIWSSIKTEYITSKNYRISRNEYFKDRITFQKQLIDKTLTKINSFQKLNPVDRKTVEEGVKLIDLEASTRNKFLLNTLMNYFRQIYQ